MSNITSYYIKLLSKEDLVDIKKVLIEAEKNATAIAGNVCSYVLEAIQNIETNPEMFDSIPEPFYQYFNSVFKDIVTNNNIKQSFEKMKTMGYSSPTISAPTKQIYH